MAIEAANQMADPSQTVMGFEIKDAAFMRSLTFRKILLALRFDSPCTSSKMTRMLSVYRRSSDSVPMRSLSGTNAVEAAFVLSMKQKRVRSITERRRLRKLDLVY